MKNISQEKTLKEALKIVRLILKIDEPQRSRLIAYINSYFLRLGK